MKGLTQLQKQKKSDLRKMAKKMGIRVYESWTRPVIARKILEKQKLNELEEPEPGQALEPEEPKRKLDFESLTTEHTEDEPESSQEEDVDAGWGGFRPGAGRPTGSDEELRVQRIRKNQVSDPVIKFAFECLFEGWESAVKVKGLALSKDEADTIAIPTTNLKEYYFPGLNLSPVLEMWIGLAIGVKAVVQSRIELIRESRKSEPVAEPVESDNDAK